MSSKQPGLGHQAKTTSLSLASKKDRNWQGDGEGRDPGQSASGVRGFEAEPSRGTLPSTAQGSPGSMNSNSPTARGGVSAGRQDEAESP